MTVINGIEIDVISHPVNEIRAAIINNDPIEENLHVICVISNPCNFATRYILAREFIKRMESELNIILYIVELAYKNQKYYVTDSVNPRHLQLTASVPLWHKENLINIGVKKLLPSTWKAFAWIDADIEFENTTWAMDTLKVLNGSKDIVQLFSHAVDMNKKKDAMSIFPSFGYQYVKGREHGRTGINMWHPGYCWAMTKRAYNKIGGLYDISILGAGDHNMALSFIGKGLKSINDNVTDDYRDTILAYEEYAKTLRLGYIPGVISHYYHGSKKDRQYMERWQLLVKYQYKPSEHVMYRKDGLLIPTLKFPPELLDCIQKYFLDRNEDK